MGASTAPRLAVWKFASCDGCQLSLLDCEDELLDVAANVEIAHFLEATRATAHRMFRSRDSWIALGSVPASTNASAPTRIMTSGPQMNTSVVGGSKGVYASRSVTRPTFPDHDSSAESTVTST